MEPGTDVVMFNSPLYNDQNNYVYMFQYNAYSNLPDYSNRNKRHLLNECIHLMYVLRGLGHKMNFDNHATVQCSQDELKRQLDNYTQPERKSQWRKKLLQCKRQLFREPQQSRKQRKARRNPHFGITEVIHVKPVRHLIRRPHIRRGFLNPVRRSTLYKMLSETFDEMNNSSHKSLIAPRESWPTWIPIPLRT